VTERRVSVDFTVDRMPPVAIDGNGSEIHFIPLTLMRKRPMVKFSLRDEDGRSLPVLTYQRCGALALSVLVVLGEALAAEPDDPVSTEGAPMPEDVVSDLRSIVMDDPRDRGEVRECLRNEARRARMGPRSI